MTSEQYKKLRQSIGTQEKVARMLNLDPGTISRRERGDVEIDREMEYALRYLKGRKQ